MATLCGRLSSGLLFFHRSSPLCRVLQQVKCTPIVKDGCVTMLKRGMAGGKAPKFFIKAPEYRERAMMRKFVKYLAYTGVPALGIVTYCNVFIGPAQLAEIPEGYEPKHWEYFKHPITRFIARYISHNPQQEYEKYCHYIEIQDRKKVARKELMDVKKLMQENKDGYYTFIKAVPSRSVPDEDSQQ